GGTGSDRVSTDASDVGHGQVRQRAEQGRRVRASAEGRVMRSSAFQAVLLVGVIAATGFSAWADESEASGSAVAKFMPAAKVSLQQALTTAAAQGQPVSAKFEVDEGHFQLSVYTSEGAAFKEVLVDYQTGKVAKSEALSGGDDLAEARQQKAACAKSKKSLKAAVDQAEQGAAGYRAVSVTPRLDKGHPVAVVALLKGTEVKSVSEPLE